MTILSNGAPHSLFLYIGHHTKAVYKCTISRYLKNRKYGPYRGTYTNIAKTAIASLYFQCYNPISYSGHPRGSQKYRLAKMIFTNIQTTIRLPTKCHFLSIFSPFHLICDDSNETCTLPISCLIEQFPTSRTTACVQTKKRHIYVVS